MELSSCQRPSLCWLLTADAPEAAFDLCAHGAHSSFVSGSSCSAVGMWASLTLRQVARPSCLLCRIKAHNATLGHVTSLHVTDADRQQGAHPFQSRWTLALGSGVGTGLQTFLVCLSVMLLSSIWKESCGPWPTRAAMTVPKPKQIHGGCTANAVAPVSPQTDTMSKSGNIFNLKENINHILYTENFMIKSKTHRTAKNKFLDFNLTRKIW